MDDFEQQITPERLSDAVDILVALQEAFGSLQMLDEGQERQAAIASTSCVLAGLYLVEMLRHLKEGQEFYQALRTTLRGETPIDPKLAKELESAMTSTAGRH